MRRQGTHHWSALLGMLWGALSAVPAAATPCPLTLSDVAAGQLPLGRLSAETQALLGVGPFFEPKSRSSSCSEVGFEISDLDDPTLIDAARGLLGNRPREIADPRPPGPGCTHATRMVDGTLVVLPGACRFVGAPAEGPAPNPEDSFPDKTVETAWNLLITLVHLSSDDGIEPANAFDPDDPFRIGGCSLSRPNLCAKVQEFAGVPEPASLLLVAAGSSALLFGMRKRRG